MVTTATTTDRPLPEEEVVPVAPRRTNLVYPQSLIDIITSEDPVFRHLSLQEYFETKWKSAARYDCPSSRSTTSPPPSSSVFHTNTVAYWIDIECKHLHQFCMYDCPPNNLYYKVRGYIFLYGLYRFHLPPHLVPIAPPPPPTTTTTISSTTTAAKYTETKISYEGYTCLLERDYESALHHFYNYDNDDDDDNDDDNDNDNDNDTNDEDATRTKTTPLHGTMMTRTNNQHDGFAHSAIQNNTAAARTSRRHHRRRMNRSIASALAKTYYNYAFALLSKQVQYSVRDYEHATNPWMFGSTSSTNTTTTKNNHNHNHNRNHNRLFLLQEYPLKIHPKLLNVSNNTNSRIRYLLKEATPVRMDFTHSGWSDIFFLNMDYPECAKVINASINLCVIRGGSTTTDSDHSRTDDNGNDDDHDHNNNTIIPTPPIETYLEVIHPTTDDDTMTKKNEDGVLKLTSIDLQKSVTLTNIQEVFNYSNDYLGLLKAGIVASGIVPPVLEGQEQEQTSFGDLFQILLGDRTKGLHLITHVKNIPKGSRLAVSTNLLASIITVCMRATGQTATTTTTTCSSPTTLQELHVGTLLSEDDRQKVQARAILGEWLGGSGGGWQDSGGLWPGIKLMEGQKQLEHQNNGTTNHGSSISNGQLLPSVKLFRLVPDTTISDRKGKYAAPSIDQNSNKSDNDDDDDDDNDNKKNQHDDNMVLSSSIFDELQSSLILVHGGMAQNVGPVLELVTEKYLLREGKEWIARKECLNILKDMLQCLRGRRQRQPQSNSAEKYHRNTNGHSNSNDVDGSRNTINGNTSSSSSTNGSNSSSMKRLAELTTQNFVGPLQTIIPAASNLYTELLIERAKEKLGSQYLGFWMLGGCSGGGMGFLFQDKTESIVDDLYQILFDTKRELEEALPFAMDPVVYDFSLNRRGTYAELVQIDVDQNDRNKYRISNNNIIDDDLLALIKRSGRNQCKQRGSSTSSVPRTSSLISISSQQQEEPTTLQEMLDGLGFDPNEHEHIRNEYRSGRLGLKQNRLPPESQIEDVRPGDVTSLLPTNKEDDDNDDEDETHQESIRIGQKAIRDGKVAVITLAAGSGSRWTRGGGCVKALHPFAKFGGKFRSFLDVHISKCRQTVKECRKEDEEDDTNNISCVDGAGSRIQPLLHVVTTSHMTHRPIENYLNRHHNGLMSSTPNNKTCTDIRLSRGRSIGLRMIPTVHDLKFAWEERQQQRLDPQAQKVKDCANGALMDWAEQTGEGSDYADDRRPLQCLHPVGHYYEIPNLMLNGTLRDLLQERPQLEYLMLHNIDTVGANVDARILGTVIQHNSATLTFEVIPREIDDVGGGLGRVNNTVRMIEGLALPREDDEFVFSYYNSMTTWIHIDRLLAKYALTRNDLDDAKMVAASLQAFSHRLPTYVALKDVKKRWGRGHEDVFPTAQFEKLWSDMSTLEEMDCHYLVVPRVRGAQLKDPSQLDGWLRDGSKGYVESICDF